ncbi:hypothetical protein Krac_1265 [Ktedonobacter racemifer DSM 44963]|uniref:Uncharacterized protein n=1 Tax=Ktedonobacter racemifer DSM 44963 TaxID=485913 RepID=D6U6N8_KTERA|nr:hypothetical protein Krac_1265 [Ktedonobacter racemifer DSM 44963]
MIAFIVPQIETCINWLINIHLYPAVAQFTSSNERYHEKKNFSINFCQ